MPIILKSEFQIGWKRHNPDDMILVIRFINEKSGKTLFTFAPKYEDEKFFVQVFKDLEEYEKAKEKKRACAEEDS